MADPISRLKARWPQEKAAAFDRLVAAFVERAEELAESHTGADLAIHVRIANGSFSEGRLDRDERFA